MTTTLAPLPVAPRGSGEVRCDEPTCSGHREKCLFGAQHVWQTWLKDGRLMRTRHTYWCHKCSGVCIAEEN